MQNVSSSYLEKIKEPSRSFECRVTIGNNVYTNADIINISIEDVQPTDGFTIGAAVSKSLELTLSTSNIIYSNSKVKLEIGLNIGSTFEYILIGHFHIEDIISTDYSTKLTCYDNMIKFEKPYFSNLGKTSSLKNIINELATITGVEFTGSLPSYNLNKLEGFTCREILGFVASICGGNAYITREGKFTIKTPETIDYSITSDNYIDLKSEEDLYKVGAITCKANDKEFTKGTLSNSSMEITFENPWVTESILTDIYNKLKGFEFIGYSMKWQGDFSLDVGDIISITDTKGNTRQVPIFSQKFTYNGGLTSEIGAKGESKTKNEFSPTGDLNNKVNRIVTDLLIVNKALINKADVEDLKAVNGEIDNLIAVNVTITGKLNAIEGEFGTLKANVGVIDKLTVTHTAQINDLKANSATITQLDAVSAKIGIVEADVGKINTLLAGNITGENIQAGGITSDKLTIVNGFITNAMIANLDVSKINAGDISTNKFRIKSDNGGIEIVGATQQFKDKNNKVRIQMGQDTQGNFNFIIRSEDGTTTLIDHTGIKEKAIADDLIKETMIAQDAIGEKQINYSSFITGFNKDTNTNTIKSTKIMLNNQNQTLDVAFSSLKTQADGTKSLTESHSTTIGVMQGQISTAINNTQIVKDGQTILLKDDYNRTVQTVDSMKSTIGSHTTQISGLNSTVSTQGSSISQLKNQIALKVEQTDITTAIDNIQVGIKNLVPNSKINQTSNGYGFGSRTVIGGLKNNTTYTFTVNGRTNPNGNTEGKYLRCYIYESKWNYGSWSFVIKETVDTTKSLTFTTGSEIEGKDVTISFYYYPSGGDRTGNATVNWCTLVEGNKAMVDWSPAPEDLESAINSKANSSDVYTKTEVYTKSQTDSAIKIAKDEINLKVSSTETQITTIQGQVNTANSNIDKATELAKAMSLGKMLYVDPIFKNDKNNIGVYNNSANGTVTVNRITKISDCPTSSTHCLEIKTTGTASPYFGGFYFGTPTKANRILITRIIAKIPTGRNISWHSNATGTGGGHKWLTSTAGTGKWEEYICRVKCGDSGTFSSTNYFAIKDGSAPTATSPLVWYLAYATVFDITDMDYTVQDHTTQISSTNNKVSSIETNLSSITSRVGTVESKQTTIDGKVTSLETWKKTAEQQITETAITNTVRKSFYTKSETESAITSKGYQTSSQVQQTVDTLQAKFSQSGGYNLIKNSTGASGDTRGWTHSGTNLGVETNDTIGSNCRTYMYLDNGTTTSERFAYSSRFKLKPSTKYTFVGYFHNYTKCPSFDVWLLSSTTLSDTDTSNNYTNTQILINSQSTNNSWKKYKITFTTPASTRSGFIRIDNNGYNANGTNLNRVHWNALLLVEGEIEIPWSPHPSEVYDGITTIDKDGIVVTSSNVKSKTSMSANGFKITKTDTNEDVFKVNSNGRLLLDGEFTTHNGTRKSGYFGSDQVKFYNWWADTNEEIAFFYGGKTSDNKRSADIVGRDMFSIGVGTPTSGSKVLEGSSSKLFIYKNTDFGNYKISNLNGINEGTSKDIWLGNTFLRSNQLNTNMESGILNLNFWKGYNSTGSVEVKVGNGNNDSARGTLTCQNFKAYGTKNACVQTSVGYVDINAYETCDYYFGDTGETILDSEGYSYVYIDSLFSETVNTQRKYQVFLSIYGEGTANVVKRTPIYFVIKGTPGIEVGYEIKAKRKGYEDYRLERDVNPWHKGEEHGLDEDYNNERIEFNRKIENIINEEVIKDIENETLQEFISSEVERSIENIELMKTIEEDIFNENIN